jgi:hypothetical protein
LAVLRASPRRAIFDLAHLESLSSAQGLNLFVSPRTLYVLQNLVAADVTDWTRYAKQILEGGWYITPAEDDDEWQTMLDVVEGVEVEVYPMGQFEPQGTVIINEIDTYIIGTGGSIEVEVPAGKVWVVQGLAVRNEISACKGNITTRDPSSGETYYVAFNFPMAAAVWYAHNASFTLSGGMKVRASFWECTDLDHVYLQYHLVEYDA